MDNKYNGYKNRSTWLAIVHLDNTNKEVWDKYQEIQVRYKEMEEYWQELKKRDHTSYSYPFHQKQGIENNLLKLLKQTKIYEEEGFSFKEIDQKELLTRLY